MRKQFITALATVLTSSMIAIPVEAGNANWDTGGYVPLRPSEHEQWEEYSHISTKERHARYRVLRGKRKL